MNLIINAANLIFRKKNNPAISQLLKLLKSTKSDNIKDLAMIHVNLAVAYFNIRTEDKSYLELCNRHCIEALKNGHNTGYIAERLLINLEKQNRFHHAIEVCKVITSDDYKSENYAYRTKDNFRKRLTKLFNKSESGKIKDESIGNLLSENDKNKIITNSHLFRI